MIKIDYETEVQVMARTGRPRLENPRKEGIFIRLTEQEHIDIRAYAAKHNLTITQTLVRGFQALQEQEKTAEE